MQEKQKFFRQETWNTEDIEDCFEEKLRCRKKLAILFVHDIIVLNTNCRKTFSTADLICRLDRYPYSITIEHKAVSRIIDTLAQEYPYIVKNSNGRVWFDKSSMVTAA